MATRYKKNEMPTSVILRTEQAQWLRKDAIKFERSYSAHLRFIVAAYIEFNSKKKDFSKPAEKAGGAAAANDGE